MRASTGSEDHGGEGGEQKLGADVAAEHDIDVVDDAGEGTFFVVVFAEIDDTGGDGGGVCEEEEGEDRDEDEPPEAGEGAFQPGGGERGVTGKVAFVGKEELLDLLLALVAPAVVGADLGDELAGGDLVGEMGERDHELACLAGDARAERHDDAGEQREEDGVDNGDGGEAVVVEAPGEAGDEGLKKIGEEDGEEEEGEGAAGGVQEVEDDGEEERGEENAEGAGVPEFVEHGWALAG